MAFALAAATHGVLDTLTVQGPPVAFLSPFSSARYELPWQPINPSRASLDAGFLDCRRCWRTNSSGQAFLRSSWGLSLFGGDRLVESGLE